MSPEAFEELLLEHLDGTLTGARRQAFEDHLREHPELRARVRGHERLDRLLGELAEETGGPLVNGAAARMARTVVPPRGPRRVAAGWWLAAAAALVLGAGLWWQSRGGAGDGVDEPPVAHADPPAFLEDPTFLADLPVIFALSDLEETQALLDLEDDAWMADVVALEVLDGA